MIGMKMSYGAHLVPCQTDSGYRHEWRRIYLSPCPFVSDDWHLNPLKKAHWMFVYKFFMDVYFVYCVIDLPNLCTTSQEICLIVVCDSHLPSHPVVLLDCLFQHPSGPSWSCLFSFFLCVKLALDELAYYVLSFRICAIKLWVLVLCPRKPLWMS